MKRSSFEEKLPHILDYLTGCFPESSNHYPIAISLPKKTALKSSNLNYKQSLKKAIFNRSPGS